MNTNKSSCFEINIKGSYAFFKKFNNWSGNNNWEYFTYFFPHKPFVYGLIGAILGLDGKSNPNKANLLKDFEPEYYSLLKNNLKVGIKINNPINLHEVKLNNSQKNGTVAKKGENFLYKYNTIENIDYTFFIYFEDYNKVNSYLNNKFKTNFSLYEYLKNPKFSIYFGKRNFPIEHYDIKQIEKYSFVNQSFIDTNALFKMNDVINSEDLVTNPIFSPENLPFELKSSYHDNFNDVSFSHSEIKIKSDKILEIDNDNNIGNTIPLY
jgi:CRISPR-associated protein Cas5 subtype I-B